VGEPITNDGPWVDEFSHAVELAAECPLRLLGMLHFRGAYRHVHLPGQNGRVACYARGAKVPEGAAPTAEQRRLDEALARREAAGKGAADD
jgi:hypothetical protein